MNVANNKVVSHKKAYTWESIAQNRMLKDATKAVFLNIVSRPALIRNLRVDTVCAELGIGKAKCRAILHELVAAGYLGEQERYITEGGQIRYTPFKLLITVSRSPRHGGRDVTDSDVFKDKKHAAAVPQADESGADESAAGEARDTLTKNLNDGKETPSPNSAEPPAPAVAKLLAFGVHEEMALRLAEQYSETQIDAAIAEAHRSADRNPPGFVVDALRGGWLQPNLTPKPHPPTPLSDFSEGDEEETSPDAPLSEITHLATGDGEGLNAATQYGTPEWNWNAAYHQLALQWDRPTFETYLRGAVFEDFKAGTYRIEVRHEFTRQMLQGRLYRVIRRVMSDVHGDPVELEFVVRGSAPAATSLMNDLRYEQGARP